MPVRNAILVTITLLNYFPGCVLDFGSFMNLYPFQIFVEQNCDTHNTVPVTIVENCHTPTEITFKAIISGVLNLHKSK